MMTTHTVAVYGITGHTGRFVASELDRRGVVVRGIARPQTGDSAQNHDELRSWATAFCDDPDALDRALEGSAAVINCAGPFIDTAPAIVEAALRAGVHYLDIAAEQRSVRSILATYGSEAVDRGVVVLPAMAFYGGLADLLAAEICSGLPVVDEILIGVALNYWHPTVGTRRTGERNTARRVVVSGGRLAPLPSNPAMCRWRFPVPFGDVPVSSVPLSEIITISRHVNVNRIESFMNEGPLNDLRTVDTPPPTAVAPNGRSNQRFVMDVYASGGGQQRRIAASGHDIYAVSAPLVVEACMRPLSDRTRKGGAFAPAELFDSRSFLTALSADIQLAPGDASCPITTLQ